MALNISMKGVSSRKTFAFAKGLLTKAGEEQDNSLKTNCDEDENLENSRIDKGGEENKALDLTNANITLRNPPQKKVQGGKAGANNQVSVKETKTMSKVPTSNVRKVHPRQSSKTKGKVVNTNSVEHEIQPQTTQPKEFVELLNLSTSDEEGLSL
ncbi:hypothetical protein GIB67_038720 [Kingdonia uniflora]|uniref:Uncharacterized protein n=1 Tax=Kingdonia uniflora TaxID=39325 RepID=A0A7J7NSK6_9MAGN|nr:hypothetical protein GIB67_038720 [Kingdonia uniflora]